MLDRENMQFLLPILAFLRSVRVASETLLGLTYRKLARAFKIAANRSGLKDMNLSLYNLRHGGASHDIVTGYRSLETVRKRGRWQSYTSVRRYEKASRLSDQLSRLSQPVQDHCLACVQILPDVLTAQCSARLPPHGC